MTTLIIQVFKVDRTGSKILIRTIPPNLGDGYWGVGLGKSDVYDWNPLHYCLCLSSVSWNVV